jgi:16S rRNA (guanine527-N7)-methyltransferase
VNGRKSFRDLLEPHCGGGTLDRLVRYAELLEKWSRCHNLVRYSGREELVTRHLLDSLAAAPLMGNHGRLIDVGSGAGLPGVPLLAACPGFSGVLLEPREKRWAFLKLVIRELGLDARAERARYHDLENGHLWDAVTVRAVGKQPEILGWARSRLAANGTVFLWTTQKAEEGLRGVTDWRVLSSALPGLDRGRLVRLQPCFT